MELGSSVGKVDALSINTKSIAGIQSLLSGRYSPCHIEQRWTTIVRSVEEVLLVKDDVARQKRCDRVGR